MRRLLRPVLLSLIFLNACGEQNSLPPIGFVNQTRHSDAQLWILWNSAQQSLSQTIDLNPVQRTMTATAPETLPGDPRVWKTSPRQLVVAPQPDVSSTALYTATGMKRADPTGLIECPQPCNVRFAPAYSLYEQPSTRYAASWEFSGDNFDFLVQYEFENQILNALGYNTRWR